MIRRPAVAGAFYDADPGRLRSTLEEFLEPATEKVRCRGILVPHAGYRYSGAVAGAVYGRVEPVPTYVVLGPNHTGLGPSASIMARGLWETPLGGLPVDEEAASAMISACDLLREDGSAHVHEHAVEVQLPFLQVLGARSFVPVTLMPMPFGACHEVAAAVAAAVQSSADPVVVVASSDMTHFEDQESARARDAMVLERIEALDARGLYDVVRRERISMCGFIPATVMLLACLALGAERCRVVRYATSGDVTGDRDQVVGYAGVIVE